MFLLQAWKPKTSKESMFLFPYFPLPPVAIVSDLKWLALWRKKIGRKGIQLCHLQPGSPSGCGRDPNVNCYSQGAALGSAVSWHWRPPSASPPASPTCSLTFGTNSVYRKIHFAQNKLSKISALLGLGLPHGKTHSFTQLSVDQSFLPQIASHFTDLRRSCSSSSVPQMAGRSTYQPLT